MTSVREDARHAIVQKIQALGVVAVIRMKDAAKLRANLRILAEVRDEAGIKMLSALKAFSM